MKKYLILLIICFALIGCSQNDEAVKGAFDKKGMILEVDNESSRILVEEVDGSLIWITLPDTLDPTRFEKEQEVVVWIDGFIMESNPAQAKALQVEYAEGRQPHSFLPKYIFKDDTFPPIVNGFVYVDGVQHEMVRGGFEWMKGNQSVQTDAASPVQIAENFKVIDVGRESEITIKVEQTPNLSLYIWDLEREAVLLKNNQLTVPTEIGRYIYEIVAKWSNGKVSYTFVIEVQ